jgi:hypothetical protein
MCNIYVIKNGYLSRIWGSHSAGLAFSLLFNPDDGSDMFNRNIYWLSMDCTLLFPIR